MPCYTYREVQVDLSKSATLDAKNLDYLQAALESMGFDVVRTKAGLSYQGMHNETKQWHSGSFVNGQLKYTGNMDVNKVKVAYSKIVIGKQFGGLGKLTSLGGSKFQLKLKV